LLEIHSAAWSLGDPFLQMKPGTNHMGVEIVEVAFPNVS